MKEDNKEIKYMIHDDRPDVYPEDIELTDEERKEADDLIKLLENKVLK